MKISRGALTFAVIIFAIVAIVFGMAWFSSLFKTPEGGTQSPIQNLFSSLFPFGNSQRPPEGQGDQNREEPGMTEIPRLRKVSDTPIAGFRFQKNGLLRYGERETGHVFEIATGTPESVRIANTTIPGIQNMIWLSDRAFVFQYLDESNSVRNFVASLASSTVDQTLAGKFIQGADDIVPSGEEKSPFFVDKTSSGVVISHVDTDKLTKTTVFSSPLNSWRPFTIGKTLYVQTAPASVTGYLYTVGDALDKVISGTGLMVLPDPSGKFILYSTSGTAGGLHVFDIAKRESVRLPLITFAEKCAWADAKEPLVFCAVPGTPISIENWYTGVAATNDTLWLVNPVSLTATVLSNPAVDVGTPIDVVKPQVMGDYAAFINKPDQTLWILRLSF